MKNLAILSAILFLNLSCSTTGNKGLGHGCRGPNPAETGRTVLLIDVDEEGKAVNIRVAESNPKGMWDATATCIVKKGVFINNDKGKTPPFKNHKVYFDMKVADGEPDSEQDRLQKL